MILNIAIFVPEMINHIYIYIKIYIDMNVL